jgi:hypothetical protein
MRDRRRIDVLAMLMLVALIFGSLYLMSEAVQQTSVLADDWFIPLNGLYGDWFDHVDWRGGRQLVPFMA